MQMVVVVYDIVSDSRREDVSTVLSGYGPRVQLSVFECQVAGRREFRELCAQLRRAIDTETDQVRLYPLGSPAAQDRVILGAREVEERQDFWIV